MFHEKISSRQKQAWLVAALAAPVAAYSGGSSWGGVIWAMAVGIGASLLLEKLWGPDEKIPKWLAVMQWLWLGVYAGRTAGYAATFWPEGMKANAVPLILIALACASAGNGLAGGAKGASVLLWLIGPAVAGIFLAGKDNVKWEWIVNTKTNWKPELFSLMLIPAMTHNIWGAEEKKTNVSPLLTAGAVGLTAVVVMNGSLTQRRSLALANPLYEYSKSVTLLGTVKGLEAVAACAFTVGWYVLLSLLLGFAKKMLLLVDPERDVFAAWGGGFIAAAVVLFGIADPAVEAWVSGAIWAAIPAIVGARKKLKKQKNNA